jgi:hypothetical protein
VFDNDDESRELKSGYQSFPFLEKGEDGRWYLPNGRKDIPFLFSLMAQKL